ncbi:hypothetical protein RhiirA5_408494 [Rhizophagus irregularis]|uniref:Uncharacterized protein n=1 Tax=Rhizophagus irregularis TaxID=588596 RepID=A0A2I1F6C2_9GLOM|nr:hypothetical protein RhiirA5_408494 [Rhizophagus irregularis]PKC58924.1 hypothetical protein RhiirA1_470224 [Rhizophagus irregularis]PKY29926.1 hypothetical protein RhiirB3_446760 [Rhizophagus irregularis]
MDNINETNYSESIKYNADNTVNVPFGRAADWYINNVPILKICRLKYQKGAVKSTNNKVDDIIILITEEQQLLQDIQLGLKND